MRFLPLMLVVATGCGPAGHTPDGRGGEAPQPGRFIPVVRVVDGDTIWVQREGREEKVRLIGVDTPEVSWYGGEGECFGEEAGRFVRRLLRDTTVRLEADRELLDPYDRTLAYAWLEDGRMLNTLLVRRGYGIVLIYPPNDRYEAELRAAEAAARETDRGLWGVCPPP